MIRILLVDDQELLRRGLRLIVGTLDGMEVLAEAADGAAALEWLTNSDVVPDIVLTDAQMPGMDGITLVQRCKEAHPALPVIVLTTFDDPTTVHGAIDAGASGYLLKDVSPEYLAEAIQAAVRGGLVIDPRVTRIALQQRANAPTQQSPSAVNCLTPAERQICALLVHGLSNGEIAARLFLAEGTVKNHVSAVLRKTECRDRTQLALLLHGAEL